MTDEPRTVAEFVDELIAERGGRERFNAIQIRLCATIALALRDPAKIEASVVRDLVQMLPSLTKPTEPRVQKLEIEFVGEPTVVGRALREEIADLQHQLAQARGGTVVERADQPADEYQRVRPSERQQTPFHEPSGNVVPLRSSDDSPWALWAEANSGGSGRAPGCAFGSEYQFAPDRVDASGKRLP
jgi:hypothetical protein